MLNEMTTITHVKDNYYSYIFSVFEFTIIFIIFMRSPHRKSAQNNQIPRKDSFAALSPVCDSSVCNGCMERLPEF